MEQFEKVCKGLGCCILRDPDDHRRCGECPYNPHSISNEPCANGLKHNALALIRQQQERIKELEAAQKWISVKDRLPRVLDQVLLYTNDGRMHVGQYNDLVGSFMFANAHLAGRVTHWMPLPELPKEEE